LEIREGVIIANPARVLMIIQTVVHLANMPGLLENLVRQPAGKPITAPGSLAFCTDGAGSIATSRISFPHFGHDRLPGA
jgi:hypothetical protein